LGILSRYKERADIRAYLEILLSLATVCLFSLFALKPTLTTIAGLFKEIEAKEETLDRINKKIQDLSTARSLYDRKIENIRLLDTAIPKGPKPEDFVIQVESLTAKYQIGESRLSLSNALILGKESSLTISKKQNDKLDSFPGGAGSIPVSFGTEVSVNQFATLTGFLSDYEFLRRPIKLDSVRISARRGEGETEVSFTTSGRVPYLVNE